MSRPNRDQLARDRIEDGQAVPKPEAPQAKPAVR